MEDCNKFKRIFDLYANAIPKNIIQFADLHRKIMLPLVSEKDVLEICAKTAQIFKDEKSLLEINTHIIIVGDIHGHILDLFYILQRFGLPPRQNYLFLGDLVDRGEFGIEAVLIVFLMKILWPRSVYLIRGNHEFFYQCSHGGFAEQLQQEYSDPSLIDMFVSVFDYIPLGAIVNRKFLCVHGGIGPCLSLKAIAEIKRPVSDMGNDIVDSLTWSDPTNDSLGFTASNRGLGYLFGEDTCIEFHRKNQTSIIIRGHECVMGGFQEFFGRKVITVFSASNYCGLMENKGAIMEILDSVSYDIKTWAPLPYLHRSDVSFTSPQGGSKSLQRVKVTQSTKVLPFYCDIQSTMEDMPLPPTSIKRSKLQSTKCEAKLTIPSHRTSRPVTVRSAKKITKNLSLNARQLIDPYGYP